MHLQELLLCALIGTAGGLGGARLHIPGGTLTGAMVAVIMLKAFTGKDPGLPHWYTTVVEIMIGIVIGASYTADTIPLLKRLAIPVVCSTLALVITGFLLSFLIVKLGILEGSTAYLSTSPGAMTALLAIAGEKSTNPPIILAFHFFRVVFIIITAPFMFHIFQKWIGN